MADFERRRPDGDRQVSSGGAGGWLLVIQAADSDRARQAAEGKFGDAPPDSYVAVLAVAGARGIKLETRRGDTRRVEPDTEALFCAPDLPKRLESAAALVIDFRRPAAYNAATPPPGMADIIEGSTPLRCLRPAAWAKGGATDGRPGFVEATKGVGLHFEWSGDKLASLVWFNKADRDVFGEFDKERTARVVMHRGTIDVGAMYRGSNPFE